MLLSFSSRVCMQTYENKNAFRSEFVRKNVLRHQKDFSLRGHFSPDNDDTPKMNIKLEIEKNIFGT